MAAGSRSERASRSSRPSRRRADGLLGSTSGTDAAPRPRTHGGRRRRGRGRAATGGKRLGQRGLLRSLELLRHPTRLSWFPAPPPGPAPVARPPAPALAPDRSITLTFSRPMRTIFGMSLPTVTPPMPGRWHLLDTHTLYLPARRPRLPAGDHVAVRLPKPVWPAQRNRGRQHPDAHVGGAATGRFCGSSSFWRRPAISRRLEPAAVRWRPPHSAQLAAAADRRPDVQLALRQHATRAECALANREVERRSSAAR